MYQFSHKKTWETWNWKERYPEQQEIRAYLRHVYETLELSQNVVFNARVSKATWDEAQKHWVVYVGTKVYALARFFIPCTGYTGQKYIPGLKGLETFEHAYHTSDWPVDLSVDGKRVGIIGTGSSGVQIIEYLAHKVAHLTVFQRSPNWALPRLQEQLTAASKADDRLSYPQLFQKLNHTPTGLKRYAAASSHFRRYDSTTPRDL